MPDFSFHSAREMVLFAAPAVVAAFAATSHTWGTDEEAHLPDLHEVTAELLRLVELVEEGKDDYPEGGSVSCGGLTVWRSVDPEVSWGVEITLGRFYESDAQIPASTHNQGRDDGQG